MPGVTSRRRPTTCRSTAPGWFGGGGAGTTWLVGSADDVAAALRTYGELGVTHFVLSDTPYTSEAVRVGDQLLPRLRRPNLYGVGGRRPGRAGPWARAE